MTSRHWQLIEDIFHAAMEKNPEDRLAYLEVACGGDAELGREIKSLVLGEGEFESLLQSMVAGAVRKLP
jgi:hypothetical protein